MQITDKLININLFHERGRHYLELDDTQLKAVSDFNRRILSSRIPFEEVPCLCENDKFSLVASIDRYGLIQSTVICKKCGLMQSNPRMTVQYYRFFYESDEYRRLYDGDNFINNYGTLYSDGCGNSIYQTIIEHKNLKKIKSVLEFGAGGGWNLLPFVRQGLFVKGYDFSTELVKLGNRKGINLIQGDIGDVKGKYDVIIASHVIEHFTNFLSDIKKLRSHLHDDGIMYIGVPDIQKFAMGHLQNAHIYYFTLKTLRYYMGKCGLRMIHHQPETGGHMSAIFVVDEPQIDDKLLEDHYEEMAKMLRRYSRLYYARRFLIKPRRFLVKVLELVGLKKIAKRILNYFFSNGQKNCKG